MGINMHDHPGQIGWLFNRRNFLKRFGLGFGSLSLASLMQPSSAEAASDSEATLIGKGALAPQTPHFRTKAKQVVHLFAQGAPSQVDTFDPKPALARLDGSALPGLSGVAMASPFKFSRHGDSGIEISEVFPRIAKHADELCLIRSMQTDIPAHDVATIFMNTGSARLARPSLGSWVTYGLGTENANMPGFISLRSGDFPPGGTQNWQSAFLPGVYQGTSVNTRAATADQMIQNIRNTSLGLKEQRRQLDLVHQLDAARGINPSADSALETRLEAMEIAFRMQAEASDAFDVSKESQATRALYGDTPQGRQMLITRRLIERGVRFVQAWFVGWDHHQDLQERLSQKAFEMDQPVAAFLEDLKQRGLLESTLVVWGGEFGRKPTRQQGVGESAGRDHNHKGFTSWMAGGGVKRGFVYGATDDFGNASVQDPVHVHDLHATILHCLGFDHTRLTFRHNGRDFRLTDVHGDVVKGVLES